MSRMILSLCLFLFLHDVAVAQGHVCNLPLEPGPCRSAFLRYYFDKNDGTCKTFIYGGCHGNGNSFATQKECQNTCFGQTAGASDPTSNQFQVCTMPADSGPCFAHYFPVYFYNASRGKCETFVYGGCGGNGNRFDSPEACMRFCNGVQRPAGQGSGTDSSGGNGGNGNRVGTGTGSGSGSKVLSSNKHCNLDKEAGVICFAGVPAQSAFFYNTLTGNCESFMFRGCFGNANRFRSKAHCQDKCKASAGGMPMTPAGVPRVCSQPQETGLCRARIRRWYFDQVFGACRIFYYGGCGGNGNNFVSQAACEQQCVSPRVNGAGGQRNNNNYQNNHLGFWQYLLMQLWGGVF